MEQPENKFEKLPRHVAFIVDGNRRWARERGLRDIEGHAKAIDRVEEIIDRAGNLGIKYVTFWLFSTENWKRAEDFINDIFSLARKTIAGSYLQRVAKKGGKINILGDLGRFPKDIQEAMLDGVKKTKDNDKVTINLALNYGGRAEILRAVKRFIKEKMLDRAGSFANAQDDEGCDWEKELTEECFSSYLYTAGQPDPDLIIRTGGELRMSGYLPWQAVYSEFYFTKTYFPDFDIVKFEEALREYERRDRRFGAGK